MYFDVIREDVSIKRAWQEQCYHDQPEKFSIHNVVFSAATGRGIFPLKITSNKCGFYWPLVGCYCP